MAAGRGLPGPELIPPALIRFPGQVDRDPGDSRLQRYSRNSIILLIAVAIFVCQAYGILVAARDEKRVVLGVLCFSFLRTP